MGLSDSDWRQRIVELVYLKQRLAEFDTTGLWEHRLPAVAATEAQLRAVEDHIGEALDREYRTFLLHANGWPAIYQAIDLFGTAELMGGERFEQAAEMLRFVEEGALADAGLRRASLLPIAASPVDLDLFMIARTSATRPGVVILLAGTEVDRFPSFSDYFLAMIDYIRLEVQELRQNTT